MSDLEQVPQSAIDVEVIRELSSTERLVHGRPGRIILYEHPDYRAPHIFEAPPGWGFPRLYAPIDQKASSVDVVSGVWRLFQEKPFVGPFIIVYPGDRIPHLSNHGMDDRILSLACIAG